MKNKALSAAAVCMALTARCVFALDATLMADGSVRFGPDGSYSLKPVLFLPEWKSTTAAGGYAIKKPGVASYRLENNGTVVADATTTLSQLDGGKAKAVFSVTPRKDVETISSGCTVALPIGEVDGKPWAAAGKEGVFGKPEKGIALVRGKTAFVEWPSGAKGPQVRIEAPSPFDCLIQDNSKWGDTYSIRAGSLSSRTLKAGEKVSFEFVVSSGEPVAAVDQKPYVIKAGEGWVPIVEHRDILEGSALDFSKAGFTDAPAGKYGWIRSVGGHFEFENLPGRPQRFYGVNFCGTANFPDHELADRLVVRLKRFGYNALRLHHHDAGTVAGSADGVTLNEENMDRFDYLVAAAIREGLYLTTDLFVSRTRAIKWRHIGIDRDGLVDQQLFKALCATYEPAYENWAAYAKNFMEHVNKYTGRRYADEPALSLISLVNEGGLFMGWNRGTSDDPRVIASWSAWLKAKRAADPSFAEGIDADTLPKGYWSPKTRPFVEQWAAELETKMVARMKAFLRSLGAKALITNDNNGSHYVARNGMAADYDYIDDHFYVDHPSFLEKRWQRPSRCPNVNQLLGSKPIVPVDRDFALVKGKPFTITEWNFSSPGRYRGVGGILTGATAALKDLDGLWRFAYSHSRDNLGDSDMRPLSYFDLSSDQLSLASDRASICLFLRRDIAPGAEDALKIDRKRGSFTIDTPRTVGGFAPEGTIDAGALRAAISGAPATVCVHSLDGEPVAKSSRMLLTHLTDVQSEGEAFADESMKILLGWGKRPLAQSGSAEISLALDSPSKFEVWEIAANGARVRKVESKAAGGRLEFTASISGPDGARMMYEIVKRPAREAAAPSDGLTRVFGAPVRVKGVAAKGMAVAIEGKRLFVGAGTKLYAFDVSSPLKPVLLGELDGFDNLRQIRVRGNFVYVVSRETGMRIVDVSDPAHMRIRSRYDSVEFATGIEVVGSVAFLSERIYGVEAVDISDPDNPAHIAIRKTHESQSCRYRDGWLFSGEWGEGELSVFDAHDMRSFRQVAKADLGGFGDGVELDGKYIYCSTGHDSLHRGASDEEAKGAGRGLDIFDISDPAHPRHVSRTDFPVFKPRDNDYWTPRVANGWAFCCDSHNGLFAVDVKDPAKPKVVDRLCIPDQKKPDWPSGAISSLEVGEGCLYMTCAPGGLFVVPVDGVKSQARPTGEPPKNASYREPYATDANKFFVYKPEASGQARSVVIRGDVAYVAFGDAGLHVLRIVKDGGFEKLGELPGGHRVTDCCFAGDKLLVAEGLDGFALYELDGPAKFREVARRPNAGPGGSVAFWCWVPDGDTMLLSSRCGPYSFFSLKDFAGKELLAYRAGACQWDRYPADAAIGGMYPILRPYKGVIWMEMSGGAVRVKDELAGVEDSGLTVEQRNGVVRFGDNFLCTVADGYEIYSPDGKPVVKWRRLGEVGKSGKGNFRAMPRTDGRFVLLTERSAKKASVWDFQDAENPKLLRKYRLSGNPDAGAFFEGRALIPAGHQGLLLEKHGE